MHFDNFPEAKQLAEPAHRRNVAIRTSDPRIHALSRSQSHAAMNGVESKLPMLPPTSSCVLSADLVKVQAPDSNIHPSLGSVQVQPSSSNVSSPAE